MTRPETSKKIPSLRGPHDSGRMPDGKPKLFDTSIIGDPQAAMDFITNILESSTE